MGSLPKSSLCLVAFVSACGTAPSTDAGPEVLDGAVDAGAAVDAAAVVDGAGPDAGRVDSPDGRVLFELTNDDGEAVSGVLYAPDGPGPFPAVIVLHGSGGLVDEPADPMDPDDPQRDLRVAELERQFEEWAGLLVAEGWVAVFPASFFSRGFFDWNTDAPADLTVEDRLRFRVFDALAALEYTAARPDVSGERIAVVGFSNGGSTVLLGMQTGVEEVPELSGLRAPSVATDFRVGIAFYPGCGLQGFVSLSSPDAYFPRAPLLVQHAILDPLLEHCPTRDSQAETRAAGLGTQDRFTLEVFDGDVDHGFDSTPDTGDELAAREAGRARALADRVDLRRWRGLSAPSLQREPTRGSTRIEISSLSPVRTR